MRRVPTLPLGRRGLEGGVAGGDPLQVDGAHGGPVGRQQGANREIHCHHAIMEQFMTTLRALLRENPNYRYTWMAQVVSEIGDYFNNIAVFALVMEKSGSGLVVTGVMLARAIPAVVAGPVAGVLLDRLDRRNIMIASDLVRAVIALCFVFTI